MSEIDLEQRRKALAELLHEQWEYNLRTTPEFASTIGDRRYNDRMNDVSEEAVLADLKKKKKFLARFQAIDTAGFPVQERLNRDLMIENLTDAIEGAEFKPWQMPVNQMSGFHIDAAQLVALIPFATVKDYDDYIARLGRFPKVLADTTANMRKGMAARLMQPKFILKLVAEQAAEIAEASPEKSPFAEPLEKLPDEFSGDDKQRIREAVHERIANAVNPAYAKFAAFVRDEYAPQGRDKAGVGSLPDGEARYRFHVKNQTTTDLTAEEIHQIGLREVARIESEMLVIANKLGFADLRSLNAAVEVNPDLKAKSGQDIIDSYQRFTDQMYARLPQLFGRLPKAKMVIEPTPAFAEASASAAEYNTGSPDGSRPGLVYVNTYQATSRKTITNESTAYHEGVPGHHMQLSIQQEMEDLPPFRRHGGENSFVEGWALYSERLGKDAGFFQDPYSDYGRLNDEMLRAIRLVVDTGLHAKQWTREEVVQYFRDHSALDEVEIQSETDRYIAWPGQALSYKIGQLTILRLRERAQQELGASFDIRAFHDEVLGAGALPMKLLEERIESWIAREKE